MRLRALLGVVAGAVLVSGAPASANPYPPPDPYHAGTESAYNLYVAKGGHARIEFNATARKKFDQAGVTIDYIHPWRALPGKPSTAGFEMPVGSRYDAIHIDGHISYPGGLVIKLKDKAGVQHTLSANGASLKIWPGIAGFYLAPWEDDHQIGKDVRLLGASFVEALTTGGFFSYHPEENSWGPTNVNLTAAPTLAGIARKYGLPIADFESVAAITVRWNERPEWDDAAGQAAEAKALGF